MTEERCSGVQALRHPLTCSKARGLLTRKHTRFVKKLQQSIRIAIPTATVTREEPLLAPNGNTSLRMDLVLQKNGVVVMVDPTLTDNLPDKEEWKSLIAYKPPARPGATNSYRQRWVHLLDLRGGRKIAKKDKLYVGTRPLGASANQIVHFLPLPVSSLPLALPQQRELDDRLTPALHHLLARPAPRSTNDHSHNGENQWSTSEVGALRHILLTQAIVETVIHTATAVAQWRALAPHRAPVQWERGLRQRHPSAGALTGLEGS